MGAHSDEPPAMPETSGGAARAPSRELPTGVVSFLFTDIEGSTRLLQELGDAYEAVQDAHTTVLRTAIAGSGGGEIRTEGDSFFAVFRTPADAVRAAVEAQRGLAAREWPPGRPLRVRMGIHTGEGRLGGDDYLGIDVNRAARIAAAAHGGQVVVSEATRALVERALPQGVTLRDLGDHRLKDLASPEHLHDLVIEGVPAHFPPLRSLDAPPPHNLPERLTSFVGREAQVAEVGALLRDHRLVTLTGPGGTGKTRLALRTAAEALADFADGVFFVDLSSTTDDALVPSAVALALGVQEQAGTPLTRSLAEHLGPRALLLVLDNFEQVTAAAPVVQELLHSAPRLVILVTSRVPLHLDGEREYAVPPLGLPDPSHLPAVERLSQYEAVALFIDRARGVRADFAVTNENAPAVAEICVRLDGLPLAIELAAVRVKLLSPEAILARLGQRLPLLTGGAAGRPDRQRTLRGAIAWSHDLLDEPERVLFARLAAFAGGATLEAVEAVCEPGEIGLDALDGVASLTDKSLLVRGEGPGSEPRVGMLETIKEFAAERLRAGPDASATLRRHAVYFARFAEEAEPHFMGEGSGLWLERCEREHDNLRAALRWAIGGGDAEVGLRIAAALWRFWQLRGHLREGRRWLDELMALPAPGGGTLTRARAHTAAGGLAYWQSDLESTRSHYEEALAIHRELGDRAGMMDALFNLGFVPMLEGDVERGKALFRESLALARALGHQQGIAQVTSALGYAELMGGNPADAIPLVRESLDVARELGNAFLVSEGLSGLGELHRMAGDLDVARDHNKESLRIFRETGNPTGIAMILRQMSLVESDAGRHDHALRLSGAASAIEEQIGGGAPTAMWANVPDVRARAESALGPEAAERAWREGRALSDEEAIALALGGPRTEAPRHEAASRTSTGPARAGAER